MKVWIAWLFAVNLSGVFFWRRIPARWVLAAVPANIISMQLLLRLYGAGHHLSLPHIVFWTPLLAYLVVKRRGLLERSPFGVWLVCVFTTDALSLALDYASALKMLFA